MKYLYADTSQSLTASQTFYVKDTLSVLRFQLANGAVANYVLLTDASGNASWQPVSTAINDTLILSPNGLLLIEDSYPETILRANQDSVYSRSTSGASLGTIFRINRATGEVYSYSARVLGTFQVTGNSTFSDLVSITDTLDVPVIRYAGGGAVVVDDNLGLRGDSLNSSKDAFYLFSDAVTDTIVIGGLDREWRSYIVPGSYQVWKQKSASSNLLHQWSLGSANQIDIGWAIRDTMKWILRFDAALTNLSFLRRNDDGSPDASILTLSRSTKNVGISFHLRAGSSSATEENRFTSSATASTTAGTVLSINRRSGSIGAGNLLTFEGGSSASADAQQPYSAIASTIRNNVAGIQSGSMSLRVWQGGTAYAALSIDSTRQVVIKSGTGLQAPSGSGMLEVWGGSLANIQEWRTTGGLKGKVDTTGLGTFTSLFAISGSDTVFRTATTSATVGQTLFVRNFSGDATLRLNGSEDALSYLNRGSTAYQGALLWQDNSSNKWILGQRLTTTTSSNPNDFVLYSYGKSADVLRIDYTSGSMTLGSTDSVGVGEFFSGKVSPGGLTTEGGPGVTAVVDTLQWTAQTGSISAVNFSNTGTGKRYRFDYYLHTTTASGSGSPTATITVNYNNGAAKTQTSATLDLATVNADISGSFVFYVASGTPTWQTTYASGSGTPQYAVRASLIALN
jgi:hypothetical protein